ncbi:MAG: MBL fold metallo-hydrolase [Deltaproteobacteria bacterium]|nr:MBL fold metallo-hydrolase [Deltaproteobacteria bacterium]MBW2193088.1 MBL fold metallo-hydrolase [Deltaproteobacteria bacterium]
MAAAEILKDLFFIERGYLNGNHFLYRSESPILIDTGYISEFGDTQKHIESLGVRVKDVSQIINTHCHCDHIGGNRIVQAQSGCDIALHSMGKHFMDTRDDWSTWWRYYNQEADFFDCTQVLEDDDVINVGPHPFEILYTPGHASDGIVLYSKKEKILISSDTLWENDLAVMTIRIEGSTALFQMMASLERLESLDIAMVYPGHGKPFKDVKSAISKSKKRIETYMFDREKLGNDLLKKIIVYTLLMKRAVESGTFFSYLMETYWFKETVDLYFNSQYDLKYDEIVNGFIERGIVRTVNNNLYTTIKP